MDDNRKLIYLVDSALKEFHCPTSEQKFKEANEFLAKDLPRRPSAWQVVQLILDTSDLDAKKYFFAANLLRTKVSRNLIELDMNQRQALFQSLVNYLCVFANQEHNIVTQLSIALAALTVQHEWPHAIPTLLQHPFLGAPEGGIVLLCVFKVFPEEAMNHRIPVPTPTRRNAKTILRRVAPTVLAKLEEYLELAGSNIELQGRVLDCFSSWIGFMEDVALQIISTSKLTHYAFNALHNPRLFTTAALCISKIIRMCYMASKNNREETIRSVALEIVVREVIQLQEMFGRFVEARDTEGVRGLTNIFVECGEGFIEWVLMGSHEAQNLVELILVCLAYPEPSVNRITLTFWRLFFEPFQIFVRYNGPDGHLPEEIHDVDSTAQTANRIERGESSNENGEEDDEDERRLRLEKMMIQQARAHHFIRYAEVDIERLWPPYLAPWIPKISEILNTLVTSAQLLEYYDDADDDLKDENSKNRWYVSDELVVIADILGTRGFMQHLLNRLEQEKKSGANWRMIEATLFAIRSQYRVNEPYDPSHPLHGIFEVLTSFQNVHPEVRNTATLCLGRHAYFLVKQPNNRLFERVLQFIVDGLNHPKVAGSSACAIRYVCECFTDRLPTEYAKELFSVYQQSGGLPIEHVCEITHGLTLYISSQSHDLQQMIRLTQIIMEPPYMQMQQLLEQAKQLGGQHPPKEPFRDVMKRISTIFKNFDPEMGRDYEGAHPIFELLQACWESFRGVVDLLKHDDNTMEKVTRCLKVTIRRATKHFASSPLSETILKYVENVYVECPRSCYLYILCIYVDEYGDEECFQPRLTETLHVVVRKTLSILHSFETFTNEPDLVEDFFELLVRYVKRAPKIILGDQQLLLELMQSGLNGMLVEHRKAYEGVMNFYKAVLDCMLTSRHQNPPLAALVMNVVHKIADQLVQRMVGALCGIIAFNKLGRMIDLCETLHYIDSGALEKMVRHYVEAAPVKTENPTKSEFLNDYFETNARGRERRAALDSFFCACVRYITSTSF